MSTVLRPDILVQSPSGESVAIVELRNQPNLSLDDAEELRRTLAGHGLGVYVPYFLILSQDTGFLWAQPWHEGTGATPVRQFSMQPVIARYLPDWPPGKRLLESSLGLVVLHWLNELAAGLRGLEDEPERSLAGQGFLDALRDADILSEPVF